MGGVAVPAQQEENPSLTEIHLAQSIPWIIKEGTVISSYNIFFD